MVKIERSDQTAGSCYTVPGRAWKSYTHCEYEEVFEHLPQLLYSYMEEQHILWIWRVYQAAGSCYTWKSLTYCEYGKNSWQLLYLEKPHIWCIQRGSDGSWYLEYKEDLAVGSCYTWKRRTRGEIERTRQLADSWQLPYQEEPNTDV